MFVRLEGAAYRNGVIIGTASRKVLRQRIRVMRKTQKQKRVPDRIIQARVRDFTRVLRTAVPHWLREAKGLAVGAGVDTGDILMLNCVPTDMDFPGGNDCTSFVSIGKDENRLFKIRDERNLVQAFYVNHPRGYKSFQLGHQIGSLGVAHFFNSDVVAGASNTGSPTDFVSDEPKLDGNHVMRVLAETASSVDEIPALMEGLLEQSVLTGSGKDRGTILIFADRHRGLVVEYHSSDYSAKFIDRGTLVISNHFVTKKAQAWESRPPNKNTLLRRARMQQLLAHTGSRPTPQEVFAISRDRKSLPHSLCNDSRRHFWMTISAQLQVVNRHDPDRSVNHVCCGNTRHSVYFPVPVTFRDSFGPMMNGDYYTCTDRVYRKFRCGCGPTPAQTRFEREAQARSDWKGLFEDAFRLVRQTA